MNRPLVSLLSALLLGVLSGCDKNATASGTTDETHSGIDISGRVFTEQGRPLGAVITRLRHTNLSDTTDGDGRFSIVGRLAGTVVRAGSVVDTLDYLRDGLLVHAVALQSWIDTLPDLFLVQRDVSGSILPGAFPIASVATTIWNAKGESTTVQPEWSNATRRYSGFVWFRYSGGLDSFQVQAKALDDSNRAIGLSQKLSFTSRAGDILIPSFDAQNLAPVSLVKNRFFSAARRTLVSLHVKASNPCGGPLTYRWNIGGGPWTPGSADTLLRIPSFSPDTIRAMVEIARTDGIGILDSFLIQAQPSPPTAKVETPARIQYANGAFTRYIECVLGDTLGLHFTDDVEKGVNIVKRSIGIPWNVEVSGKDTTVTMPFVPLKKGNVNLEYRVCDDSGGCASNSRQIRPVLPSRPNFTFQTDSSFLRVSLPPFGQIPVSRVMLTMGRPAFEKPDTFWIRPDSINTKFIRTSNSRSLSGTLNAFFLDTSFSVVWSTDAPPIAWDFETLPERTNWPSDFGYPVVPNSPVNSVSLQRTFDPVFHSNAGRVDFQFSSDTGSCEGCPSNSSSPGVVRFAIPLSDWSSLSSWEIRLRGSDSMRVEFGLKASEYLDYPGDREFVESLAWSVLLAGRDTLVNMRIDSSAWNMPLPSGAPSWTAAKLALRYVDKLEVRIVCTKNNGVCPSSAGFLIMDDIRFRR